MSSGGVTRTPMSSGGVTRTSNLNTGGAMRAFVSHESACDALRLLSRTSSGADRLARLPVSAQPLPPSSSCVTGQRTFRAANVEGRLRSLGLAGRPVDILVPSQESRGRGNLVRPHVWSRALPAKSMLVVAPDLLVSAPELVVIQLCSAQGKLDALLDAHVEAVRAEVEVLALLDVDERPVVDHPLEWERIRRLVAAVAVACEFAGTYRLGAGGTPTAYRLRPLTSIAALERAIAEVGEFQGTRRARRVCGLALEGSASPLETSIALMLTLPVDYGGFGLNKPQLNSAIDVSAYRGGVSDRDVVTPDFLWGAQRLALEYDSAEFHDGSRRRGRLGEDAVRSNILTALGYRVLRATPETVRSLPGLTLLARQVACALGTELAPTTPLQDLRRRKLYMQLMPKASERTP